MKILILGTVLSCTSTIDLNQLDTVELNQSLTSTFVYLKVNQNNFLNNTSNTELTSLSDVSVIDIFDSDYVQENIITSNFSFEIENSFNRDFILDIAFLNADNNTTKSFTINVPRNSSISHFQSYEGLDLLSLKLSQKVRITLYLQPSDDASILTEGNEMNFELKSFTNFVLKVN
ncbi:hypothetical protein EGM88_02425 [Aureibaculum marinum]|uniref:Uncharacterized protein n=1 Tax=Aureibaculum marinum TaxID=2487930 RepID=A0A3N4P133_9FLAO|nr:hypothetical protein [Aureibaculum marinum]RPE00139.1 hypothetical protein EGM88_02425 [Aureibaculum marinum]